MTTNENEIDTDQVSIYHATPLISPGPGTLAIEARARPQGATRTPSTESPTAAAVGPARGGGWFTVDDRYTRTPGLAASCDARGATHPGPVVWW